MYYRWVPYGSKKVITWLTAENMASADTPWISELRCRLFLLSSWSNTGLLWLAVLSLTVVRCLISRGMSNRMSISAVVITVTGHERHGGIVEGDR